MKKNTIAIASVTALGTFLTVGGLMLATKISAQDTSSTKEKGRYSHMKEMQQKFWGDFFNETEFEARYQELKTEMDAKKAEREASFNSSELSSYLGLTFEELKALHDEGKTLRTYISENSLDESKVLELMKTEVKTHLDEKLSAGEITQEQYDERIANLDTHITNRLNGTGKMGGKGGKGPRGMF